MPPPAQTGPIPYAELHCRTNFSFLEGASHADELAARAGELGYRALAVTDRNSLAGAVRMHIAAKEANLKLLVGAELTPVDAAPIVVWAIDRAGYGRLSRLLTIGRRNAPKGECYLTFDDIAAHATGLLAGSPLPRYSGGEGSRLSRYREIFPDRCYALAELHRGLDDRRDLLYAIALAKKANLPLVAANDVHYHVPERRPLQDVLTAIRRGCTVAELGRRRFANGERHLKPIAELQEMFALAPGAIERTVEIADRCHFSLDELRYEYPEELCPAGLTPLEYLTKLTWEGADRRYPLGQPEKVVRLIEYELALIEELHYEAYFLTVWDLIRFANERRILCQGRGSAANSAVCYCLGVTAVDPERIDVLFERFISKDRGEAPDIDVDFEHERREEVLQYLYTKYGRERAGMTAEVITYQVRSAVRDVGKALGLSLDRIDTLAKAMDHRHDAEQLNRRFREADFPPEAPLARALVALVEEILHFPRHLSQHTGGMVMTQGPLCELVPIENAAMADRTVVQWDKNDLDALGILKVDCLALGMLTAIRKGFDFIERHYHRPLTLATVPPEDPAVYDMIGKADTIGVFQIESRAQMSMLPRLKPREFYDLVIEVAIVRPGPIQGDMVHPYLRRRSGVEPVDYPDERVRSVLSKTLGVPIFQEQAMRLVVVAAGFTAGEADQFRRAMGAWRRRGVMEQFRQKLVAGMLNNGYTIEFAERLFRQLQGFGEYGFPESHAASFALLVYVSAWIKHHYPDAFAAALINSQPMGFYAPAQLIGDAQKHGVEILPIDVNASDWDCTLEARADDRRAGGVSPPRESVPREDEDSARDTVPRGADAPRSPSIDTRSNTSENRRADDRRAEGVSPPRESVPREDEDSARDTVPRGADAPRSPSIDTRSNTSENRRADDRRAEGVSPPRESVPREDEDSARDTVPRGADAPRSPNSYPLRLGFRLIRGLAKRHVDLLLTARQIGPFTSFDDVKRRTGLRSAVLQRLARADAFRSLDLSRRSALWQALPEPTSLPLFDACDAEEVPQALPKMSPLREVLFDYGSAGLTLRDHPMSFLRNQLNERQVVAAARLGSLKSGNWVKVAGVVLLRQRPGTAKGITFVTLEDETGIVNLIVRQKVWERYRRAARAAVVMLAHGRLQREGDIIHVLTARIEDWSDQLGAVDVRSRDFR